MQFILTRFPIRKQVCCLISCWIILLALTSISVYSEEKTKWLILEKFTYEWNDRGNTLFFLEGKGTNDRGVFMRLRIHVPGNDAFIVTDDLGFEAAIGKESWTPPSLQKVSKQFITSENVLMLPLGVTSETKTVLFLIGCAYASSPGSLRIIILNEKGPPAVLFHREEMQLCDFKDLDGDGIKELIGLPCLHQAVDQYTATYDPYLVFRLEEEKATLDRELTKQYNLKHYVWAGFECSEEYFVEELPGKEPTLIKSQSLR